MKQFFLIYKGFPSYHIGFASHYKLKSFVSLRSILVCIKNSFVFEGLLTSNSLNFFAFTLVLTKTSLEATHCFHRAMSLRIFRTPIPGDPLQDPLRDTRSSRTSARLAYKCQQYIPGGACLLLTFISPRTKAENKRWDTTKSGRKKE